MRPIYAIALAILFGLSGVGNGSAAGAPARVTGVTVSHAANGTIVEIWIQGDAQYQWHRLRAPDNRFWLDIMNAQLTASSEDTVEPVPLGEIRLHQINSATVRLAIALTDVKAIDVQSTKTGVQIVVHPENADDNVARSGTGTISGDSRVVSPLVHASRTVSASHSPEPSDTIGPTAAEIAAIENGTPASVVGTPAVTSAPHPTGTPAAIYSPSPTPSPANPSVSATPTGQPDTGQGPSVKQIAAMTGEATPTPNPILVAAPTSAWKFGPPFPKPDHLNNYGVANPNLIVIDPGHGGSDRGAIHGSTDEATINLDMAMRLRNILVANGWQVMMTHSTDVDVYQPNDSSHDELQARDEVANHAGARMFISVHSNGWFTSEPSGTTTFYSKPIDVPLATDVQNALVGALGTKDDGIVKARKYVTLHANMPAILVETAFLSNPDDLAKLISPQWRQKIAQAIADGIASYTKSSPNTPAHL